MELLAKKAKVSFPTIAQLRDCDVTVSCQVGGSPQQSTSANELTFDVKELTPWSVVCTISDKRTVKVESLRVSLPRDFVKAHITIDKAPPTPVLSARYHPTEFQASFFLGCTLDDTPFVAANNVIAAVDIKHAEIDWTPGPEDKFAVADDNLLRQLLRKVSTQRIRGVPLISLMRSLFSRFGPVYIVGGAVRDVLRKLPLTDNSDIDLVVAGQHEQIVHHVTDFFVTFSANFDSSCVVHGSKQTKFGQIKISKAVGDGDDIDIACMKSFSIKALTRMYRDGGALAGAESDYLFGASIIADALSRDFTFHAIYVDVITNRVLDPFGAIHAVRRNDGTTAAAAHQLDIRGRVVHELVSVPLMCQCVIPEDDIYNRYAATAFTCDFGGHFRLFKELAKAGDKFRVIAEKKTMIRVLTQLNSAAQFIVQIASGAATKVSGHEEAFGVPWPDAPNKHDVINKWLNKLCRKLFPPTKVVVDEIKAIKASIKIRQRANRMVQFDDFISKLQAFANQRFCSHSRVAHRLDILPMRDHPTFNLAAKVFKSIQRLELENGEWKEIRNNSATQTQ